MGYEETRETMGSEGCGCTLDGEAIARAVATAKGGPAHAMRAILASCITVLREGAAEQARGDEMVAAAISGALPATDLAEALWSIHPQYAITLAMSVAALQQNAKGGAV